MEYITFREEDDRYRRLLGSSVDNKFEHAYVKEDAKFEVFRLEHKPLKLVDFIYSKIADVSREGSSISAVFSQNIAYDKDYYYLFRAVNTQGFPSNPTDIYQVKIQKGIEKNKLIVNTYKLKDPEQQDETEKKFTKLLHIMPNVRDTFIREETISDLETFSENINKVEMGLNEDFTVWGKKYKIRVRSNNTGKKIDLNLNFKIKRIE